MEYHIDHGRVIRQRGNYVAGRVRGWTGNGDFQCFPVIQADSLNFRLGSTAAY